MKRTIVALSKSFKKPKIKSTVLLAPVHSPQVYTLWTLVKSSIGGTPSTIIQWLAVSRLCWTWQSPVVFAFVCDSLCHNHMLPHLEHRVCAGVGVCVCGGWVGVQKLWCGNISQWNRWWGSCWRNRVTLLLETFPSEVYEEDHSPIIRVWKKKKTQNQICCIISTSLLSMGFHFVNISNVIHWRTFLVLHGYSSNFIFHSVLSSSISSRPPINLNLPPQEPYHIWSTSL